MEDFAIRNALEAICKLGEDTTCGTSTNLHRPLTEVQLHLIETLLDDEKIQDPEDENITILDYLPDLLTLGVIGINNVNSLKFKPEFKPGISYGLNAWLEEWIEWMDYIESRK